MRLHSFTTAAEYFYNAKDLSTPLKNSCSLHIIHVTNLLAFGITEFGLQTDYTCLYIHTYILISISIYLYLYISIYIYMYI